MPYVLLEIKKRHRNWNRKLEGIGIRRIRRFPFLPIPLLLQSLTTRLRRFDFHYIDRKDLAIPIPHTIRLTSLSSLVGTKLKRENINCVVVYSARKWKINTVTMFTSGSRNALNLLP